MSNMYSDSVKQWSIFVGCEFECIYCLGSFQRQMKRQKRNCEQCYRYEPHYHRERLNQSLPKTRNDEFIWVASSSDISFASNHQIDEIIDRILDLPDRTFLLQSKDPNVFFKHRFPLNCLLGITLETNSDLGYKRISVAPLPSIRLRLFQALKVENRKIIIIEPIMRWSYTDLFVAQIRRIKPDRVYIGYDTKGSKLPEPKLSDTLNLIERLEKFTKVKRKLIREAWNLNKSLMDYKQDPRRG